MSIVSLQNVPAVIEDFHSPRGAARVKDSGESTVKQRVFTVLFDVTDPTFINKLDAIFPGVDIAIKAAAKKNDGTQKSAAFTWAVMKKLPMLTVAVRNKAGDVVLSVVNAKVKSKPVLRVALGVEQVLMPVTLQVGLSKEHIDTVLAYQENDVTADLSTSQMEISEVKQQTATGEKQPKQPKPKKNSKTNITLVPHDDLADDDDGGLGDELPMQ